MPKLKTPKKKKTTTEDATEIVVVLDRSGSMTVIKADMEGGFDTLIEEQKKEPGECRVTLNQFDTQYENVYTAKLLNEVPKLDLVPRGMTALFDAVGKAVFETSERLSGMKSKPKVLCVVITDGAENSSHEYNAASVKTLLDEKRKEGWEFVFIGADESSFKDAAAMGFDAGMTMSFNSTGEGTRQMTKGLSAGIRSYRSHGMYVDPNQKS